MSDSKLEALKKQRSEIEKKMQGETRSLVYRKLMQQHCAVSQKIDIARAEAIATA